MFSKRGTLFRPGRTRTHADDDEVSFPPGDVLAPRPSSQLEVVGARAVSAGESIAKTMTLPIARSVTRCAREKSQICKQLFFDVPFPWTVRPPGNLSLGNRYRDPPSSSYLNLNRGRRRGYLGLSLKQNIRQQGLKLSQNPSLFCRPKPGSRTPPLPKKKLTNRRLG